MAPGSPLARGRTGEAPTDGECSSLVKQPNRRAELAPGLIFGRWGRPVFCSFAVPECEGWRAEHACPGFRQGGPGVTGRPRARGLAHPCADEPALSQRATRHRSAFAFTAAGPAV